jgi:hypothetical protein
MRSSLIFAILLAACSPILGSEKVRAPAEIAGYNADDPRIEIGVNANVLQVVVTSYGNGCYTQGETEVAVSNRTVDVRPYDYRSARGACPDILLTFTHAATVAFPTSGAVKIRVHGQRRDQLSAGSNIGAAVVVERSVTIP